MGNLPPGWDAGRREELCGDSGVPQQRVRGRLPELTSCSDWAPGLSLRDHPKGSRCRCGLAWCQPQCSINSLGGISPEDERWNLTEGVTSGPGSKECHRQENKHGLKMIPVTSGSFSHTKGTRLTVQNSSVSFLCLPSLSHPAADTTHLFKSQRPP